MSNFNGNNARHTLAESKRPPKHKTPFILLLRKNPRSKHQKTPQSPPKQEKIKYSNPITASKWRRRLLYYYYIQRQCKVWSVHFPPESEVRAVDNGAVAAAVAVPSGTSVDTVGIVSSRQSTIYSIVSGYYRLQYLFFFCLFLTFSSTSSLVASAPSVSS